jgi:hypothetical protein
VYQRGVGKAALALLILQPVDQQAWAELGILPNEMGIKIMISDL